MDEEGYVYILDRIKDMINRGGEKIWSLEVENVLYRNPKILEAAVVGVPDAIFGEEVKAVIVLKPGEKGTPQEIQEFCSRHLAKYKVPKYVEFRDILPRNPAGKVIKGELK
jgi:acyl-CoA synthetase (AMP-forming)/AMP-acid ligase II